VSSCASLWPCRLRLVTLCALPGSNSLAHLLLLRAVALAFAPLICYWLRAIALAFAPLIASDRPKQDKKVPPRPAFESHLRESIALQFFDECPHALLRLPQPVGCDFFARRSRYVSSGTVAQVEQAFVLQLRVRIETVSG